MSDASKAVFLSYASQDAEAAKKICEALRVAGVEVWFDQSELVGGDAWDQKIRKQIKDCALLIPIISAATQARTEGYFRLEWRLADQRTHLMAKGRPFLLPVVIDDTSDADAHVPDSFTEVQWTRLPGGESASAFAARVKKLLTPEEETGRPRPAERDGGVASPAKSKRIPPWLIPTVAALAAIVGLAIWQPWRSRVLPTNKSAGEATVQPALASAPVFPQDPELRRAWNLIFNALNAEDFALAEEIVKAAVDRHPADPEPVIVYAWLNDSYINRGFDLSEERFVLGKRYADRAVKLAPNDPEALAALGQFLSFRNADLPRAEQLLRHAIELNPREPRFYRALAHNVLGFSRPAEGLLFSEHVAELFPQDALAHYELALAYRDADRVNDMERAFDQCLALAPIAGAIIWKAWIVGWMHGDVPGMKSLLDRLPADSRLTDRAVIVRYQYSILSQQPAEVADALRTLQAFPGPTLRDFFFTGPKALLIGDLYAAQGKAELAKGQYEAALTEIDHDKISAPADYGVLTAEYWTLLGLGRRDEALADVRLVIGSRSPEFRQRYYRWWFSTVPASLLLGDRELAVEEIKQLAASAGRSQLRMAFRIDPRVAAFRDDAEIMALIAEPAKTSATLAPVAATVEAPVKVDEKSVAVLAFANLSDDKGNEYFSDGISEELLNVLAKIPGLKVTARTSSFHFKGKDTPIPEIAQQLGVAYVVEGSVRKSGDKVRITAQLIKAADGFQVWSDNFDRELKDIFAVQDEIAGLIAKNLELKMGMTPARPAIDVEAYQEYLAGRAAAARDSAPDLREAVMHFERAVSVEPKFTAAWVQLAGAYTRLGRWGGAPTLQAWSAARMAIAKAQALEPDSPDVLLALGWIRRTADWDWRGAERAFRRSLQLQPNQPDALTGAAVLLFNIGQTEEAIRLGQQAAQLDPLNSATQVNLSLMFYFNQNWAESERSARRALQLAPGGSYHGLLSWSLTRVKRYAEAEAEARQEGDELEQTIALSLLALAQGQDAAVRECRARLEAIAKKRGDDTADLQQSFAWIDAALGDKDRAFADLEKARASRDPSMSWLRNDDHLAPLYSDPRWNVLLHQVGLADDQLK